MTEEEMNFDLSAKKKKKKKKTFDLDGAVEPEEKMEEGGEEETKKVTFDAEEADNVDDIDLESFGKKKKKKKKRDGLDMDDVKEALPDDENKENNDDFAVEDDLDLESFGDKKKKKKKKKPKDLDDLINDEDDKENEDASAWADSDRDYTYEELLQRVFGIIRDKNPEMVAGEKKKFVMRPPQVVRVGTKKTAFANFTEIAKMLHRQPKHLLSFLFAELGTSGAIDGSNQLIMKGRFQQKHIENVLRRYIKEYVTCHTCRSPDTILNKETRLFFLQCMTCHSSCSVQTIKTGFQAVTGKRSAIRAKQ
jgi:translation initiation factor 2 subunit 2